MGGAWGISIVFIGGAISLIVYIGKLLDYRRNRWISFFKLPMDIFILL